jgi:acetoin utilization deacetylase AcuC-like enzyme
VLILFVLLLFRVFKYVRSNFEACAIVVQCGSDCLAGDPLGSFNLTEKSLIHCVQTIMKADLPMLLLGGGIFS